MSIDDLSIRLQRIYAALDANLELNIETVPPIITIGENRIEIFQDFRGGISDAEMQNRAYQLIHNIANLYYHTSRWLKKSGRDHALLKSFRSENPAVQIIEDLSNNDKHGYPPRDGGKSGRSPKLINVRRIMELRTGVEAGSGIAYSTFLSGEQRIEGSGSVSVIITGEVIDSKGEVIAQLYSIQAEAMNAWELFLQSLGVVPRTKAND